MQNILLYLTLLNTLNHRVTKTNALARKIKEIRERGTTIIMVEQNAKIALNISDRTYILSGGRIIAHDLSANFLMKKDLEQLYFK